MIYDFLLCVKSLFVVLNVVIIMLVRMEEELFGIEDENGNLCKIGVLEEVYGGMFYFDEVVDMLVEIQGKILWVFVEQSFFWVGGIWKVQVDIWILLFILKNFEEYIVFGLFWQDFYYCLSVVFLCVLGLVEWCEDIFIFVCYFMEQIFGVFGILLWFIGDDVMVVFQIYDWFGNVW